MTTVTDLRATCRADGPLAAARAADRLGLGVAQVADLLRHGVAPLPPGRHELDVVDGTGVPIRTVLHVPAQRRSVGLGLLLALHGAGSDGDSFLEQVRTLADAAGVAVVCPTAPAQRPGEHNLDLSGLFGRRFRENRWTDGPDDAPMAALRAGCLALGLPYGRSAVIGTSMGAIAAWNLCLRRPWTTAAAVVVNGAPSMWEVFGPDRAVDWLLPNLVGLPLTTVHGRRDTQIPPRLARSAVQRLRGLGHTDVVEVEVPDGEHPWDTMDLRPGRPAFETLLRRLRHASSAPVAPSTVSHRAVGDDHGRACWLELRGVDPGGASATAEVVGRHRVRLEARGCRSVRLRLPEALVDPGPLEIAVAGEVRTLDLRPRTVHLLEDVATDPVAPLGALRVDVVVDPTTEEDPR